MFLFRVWFLSRQQLPLEGRDIVKWEIGTKNDVPIDAVRFLTIRWRLTLDRVAFLSEQGFFYFLLDPWQVCRDVWDRPDSRAAQFSFRTLRSKASASGTCGGVFTKNVGSVLTSRKNKLKKSNFALLKVPLWSQLHESTAPFQRRFFFFRCRFLSNGWNSSGQSFMFGPGEGSQVPRIEVRLSETRHAVAQMFSHFCLTSTLLFFYPPSN